MEYTGCNDGKGKGAWVGCPVGRERKRGELTGKTEPWVSWGRKGEGAVRGKREGDLDLPGARQEGKKEQRKGKRPSGRRYE